MGFLSNIIGATVKIALTPIAIAVDTVNVVTGEDVDTTKDLIQSALDDIEEATGLD